MLADSPPRAAFHVMAKPTGPLCNLDCTYCYYLDKVKQEPSRASWRMSPEVLRLYIQQYIASQATPEITFAWQGGEPTLLGLAFFEEVVALQQVYSDGRPIHNAFQTNGILLNDAWCAFFRQHQFLVGISLDGPAPLHDRYRVDKGQRPTFTPVLRGLECLKRHEVEFNTLTCVHPGNVQHPLAVYRFLKQAGSQYLQFIPVVERANAPVADSPVTPWSVDPLDYGRFLVAVFDEWVRNDAGRYFIQIVDATLPAWLGREPSLCVFRPHCGDALALESNGDLYACDHFVYPEHRLGNLQETPLATLARSPRQMDFGRAKADTLPGQCRACALRLVCHGGCPKHRLLNTPGGEAGLNYLCAGYQLFFTHADPYMRHIAALIHAGQPAEGVIRWARLRDLHARGKTVPAPNASCVCGSGRKYRKCCGRP